MTKIQITLEDIQYFVYFSQKQLMTGKIDTYLLNQNKSFTSLSVLAICKLRTDLNKTSVLDLKG